MTLTQLRPHFLAVVNLRSIALVYFLCFFLVFARWLPLLVAGYYEEWFFTFFKSLRQWLISGYMALLVIGAVLTVATVRQATMARTLAWGVPLLAIMALVGAALRLWAFNVPWAEMAERWPWALYVVALWTLIGGLGLALAVHLQADARTRAQLTAAACEREALDAQMLQARLSALQAQIEPHFLFNTLANVKRLYETVPARGREMLTSLIAYLRAALPSMRQSGSTVAREAELARAYLTILQMRMGERLKFSIEVEHAVRELPVPPLVLATLIENAIKHGLSPLPEGGRIDVRAHLIDATLRIEVSDTGAGFSAAGGSGVGLANTRSRLTALFGPAAQLQLMANAPRGVTAVVSIPVAEPRAQGTSPAEHAMQTSRNCVTSAA